MTSSSLLGDDSSELVDLSLASAECSETSLCHPASLLVLSVSERINTMSAAVSIGTSHRASVAGCKLGRGDYDEFAAGFGS